MKYKKVLHKSIFLYCCSPFSSLIIRVLSLKCDFVLSFKLTTDIKLLHLNIPEMTKHVLLMSNIVK